MKRNVKTLINRKAPQNILTAANIVQQFLPKVDKDPLISPAFQKTIQVCEEAKRALKPGCESCQYNSSHPEILSNFIVEYKRLGDDIKAVVHRYMGDRTWISHVKSQSWINIDTNIVEKFQFEEQSVDFPEPKPAVKPPIPSKEAGKVPEKVQEVKNVQAVVPPDPVPPSPVHRPTLPPPNPNPSPVVQPSSASAARPINDKPRKVIFKNGLSPGDVVMMTAAIRDLHKNHPNKFLTDVRTNSMPIWESNRFITKLNESDPEVEVFRAEYPLIHQSNEGPFHFSEGFTDHFEQLLGVRIHDRIGRGYIEIGPNEEGWGWAERNEWFSKFGYPADIHYWILNAGYKNDFTAKMWPVERYQKVVDHFKGRIVFVQIGHKSHNHPDMKDTINLVGKTDDRQLIRLVWASSGVLTPCSYAMTLAAAVPVRPGSCNGRRHRPCVVVAGGREPSHWQAHTDHQFIHTCGALPCCDIGGCWKSRIKPIGDNDMKDKKNMCEYVVNSEEGIELPFCMDMISADEVIRRIEMYYKFYEPGRKRTHTYNQKET
jgi:ADP-heptose:LPS heptosyltransferase